MTKAEEHFEKGNGYFDKEDFFKAYDEFTNAINSSSAFGPEKDVYFRSLLNRGVVAANINGQHGPIYGPLGARSNWLKILQLDKDAERLAAVQYAFQNLPEQFRPTKKGDLWV